MGWPVQSPGNNFYALVMGIWCRIVCLWVGGLWGKHLGSLKSWHALMLKCPPLWSYSSLVKVLQQPCSSNCDNTPIINLVWPVMSHQLSHRGYVTLLVTPTTSSLMQGAAGTYRLLLLIIMLVSSWQLVPELEATCHVRATWPWLVE